jgi:hypothetical protein
MSIRSLDVTTEDAPGDHTAGAMLRTNGSTALVLFATPLHASLAENGQKGHSVTISDGVLSTDARAAVVQFSPTWTPLALVAIDCSFLEWTGRDAFRTSPEPGERDLHLHEDTLRRLCRAAAARPVG